MNDAEARILAGVIAVAACKIGNIVVDEKQENLILREAINTAHAILAPRSRL